MSVAEDISSGVVALVTPPGTYAVRERKQPDLLDGESPPLVVVSVLEDDATPVHFESGEEVGYLVAVTLVRSNAGLVTDDTTGRAWKELTRNRLAGIVQGSLPGVTVYGVEVLPRAPFPRPALRAGLDYVTAAARVRAAESRV